MIIVDDLEVWGGRYSGDQAAQAALCGAQRIFCEAREQRERAERADEQVPHAYDRACRNTQHPGCTCLHVIDGRWCGKARTDPIHVAEPSAADGEGQDD